jgi:hypothetical protein
MGVMMTCKWNTIYLASMPLQFRRLTPVAPRPVPCASGDLLREMDARCQVFGGDVEQVGCVRTGDNEGVPMRHQVDVRERYGSITLSTCRRWCRAGDDSAESAADFGTHRTGCICLSRPWPRHAETSEQVPAKCCYTGDPGSWAGVI